MNISRKRFHALRVTKYPFSRLPVLWEEAHPFAHSVPTSKPGGLSIIPFG